MSGAPGENSSAVGGKKIANSLLVAASQSLDDNNLLLLQDISLQDEPVEPHSSTEPAVLDTGNDDGAMTEFDIQEDTAGFETKPVKVKSLDESTNCLPLQPASESIFSYLNILRTRGTPERPSISDIIKENEAQQLSELTQMNQSGGGTPVQMTEDSVPSDNNFASSLFKSAPSNDDPFQVSLVSPPAMIRTTHNPNNFALMSNQSSTNASLPAQKTISSNLAAPLSHTSASHISKTGPILNPMQSTVPVPTPLHPSTSTPNLGDFGRQILNPSDSVPLFAANVENQNLRKTVSSNFLPAMSSVTCTRTSEPIQYHYDNGATHAAVPMYNPSLPNTTGTQPPPANPQFFSNSTPPKGPPISQGGQNQFRLNAQRPVYAQYPGISASEVGLSTSYMPNTVDSFQVGRPVLTPEGSGNNQVSMEDSEGLYNFGAPVSRQIATNMSNQGPQIQYSVPKYHWYFKKEIEGRPIWKPFSLKDSSSLEQAFASDSQQLVSTDGGRYDVDIAKRIRTPAYWDVKQHSEVRRCLWLYKGPLDNRFIPYDEEFCRRLEAEYYTVVTTGIRHKRLELGGGEVIIFHSPSAVVHVCQAASPDEWGNIPENELRPRVVKRGVDDLEIDEGEADRIDHLVFVVHGIGRICDFKFRSIVEAVDDFRGLSSQLLQTHFKEALQSQSIGRIEFLPIEWHSALHGDGGIDERLKPITLNSIPKLRSFTNDTLLDILFYTSPVFSQTIVDAVGKELNRMYKLFCSRNPSFNGMVALAGHSLGSLILFDILYHQPETLPAADANSDATKFNESNLVANVTKDGNLVEAQLSTKSNVSDSVSKVVSFTGGYGCTNVQMTNYPLLDFQPTAFFAMGSPIAMFATVRGVEKFGVDFRLPTVPTFLNIFHPFDPVAYRIEPLIDPSLDLIPVLIPHHKGRKRFHLEFKETMTRVGSELKNKFLDSLKTTWDTMYQLTSFGRSENLEQDLNHVMKGELSKEFETSVPTASVPTNEFAAEVDVPVGKLNGGRRIDYVLQEAPVEIINEYISALTSHVVYWSSEDTMLLIMKEIYQKLGIAVDTQTGISSTAGPSSTYHDAGFPPVPPVAGYYQPNLSNTSNEINNVHSQGSFPSISILNQYLPSPSTDASLLQMFPLPKLYDANSLPVQASTSAHSVPTLNAKSSFLGARPVVSAEQFPVSGGMDPTTPISSNSARIGPPPLSGFVGKRN